MSDYGQNNDPRLMITFTWGEPDGRRMFEQRPLERCPQVRINEQVWLMVDGAPVGLRVIEVKHYPDEPLELPEPSRSLVMCKREMH